MTENQLPVFFRYRFWWHLLFWVVVYFIYVITFGGRFGNYSEELYRNLVLLPPRMIGTYLLTYLILPLALKKKRFVLFAMLVVVHAFFFGFIVWFSLRYLYGITHRGDITEISLFNLPKIISTLFSNYLIPVFAAAVVIFKKWYLDQQKNKKLAEEKLAAELSFLKAQVHPHFLFNTLNNLYALTLIKSEKTPDIVLKLSDLLDYMIYKSNDAFVPLKKELEILEGYIELEKMRYNERLELKYEINGDASGHEIAPLILLPFIENSFKHGASKDRSKPSIHIKLNIGPDFLALEVMNSVPFVKNLDETEREGIGLKNVKRRLELIYPGRHELLIYPGDTLFKVEFKIFWKK
ncbi:MAG: histidine kinase [Mariniphaga sp.]|nr:histidine kinase [Mariniphaga sp.]